MGKYAYPLGGRLPHGHAKYYSDRNKLISANQRIIIGWPNGDAHNDANGGWKSTNGVDFVGTPYTTVIRAVTTGTVKNKKPSKYDAGCYNGKGVPRGSGHQFEIHGDDGSVWFYTHTWGVGSRTRVSKGETISSMFPYWYRSPHLHISKAGGGTARNLFLHKVNGRWV